MKLDIEGFPITDEQGKNICQGCEDTGYPGIRWPSDVNGDTSRSWIERCDYCERYESDRDAARALIAHGVGINIGFSIPMGCLTPTPYLISVWHQPENFDNT